MIDSKHFAELLAYDAIEGVPRPVREAGMIASTMANCMSTGKKRFKPRDFMPVKDGPQGTAEDGIAGLMAMRARRLKHDNHR